MDLCGFMEYVYIHVHDNELQVAICVKWFVFLLKDVCDFK